MITFVENDPAQAIDATGITLASGRRVAAEAVLVTTKAEPPAWFAATDLPRDKAGYLALRPTLQVLDDDDVFAAGDCATVLAHPREKAGVFAVRQGTPLAENLRLRADAQPVHPFVPQRQFLTLLSTGGKHAVASRGPIAFAGAWVWRWKDRIDREFMERFNDLPPRDGPFADASAMRCTGCAAKVGPAPLARALDRIEALKSEPGPVTARDDATVIDEGGPDLRLETVDFFPAFWPEPYVLGEIAARHAMGDIFAMGGRPERAQAILVLPHAGPRRTEEDVFQLLAGARAAFDAEGVEIAGGHTSEGQALSIGFHVSGRVTRDGILRKRGLKAGDRLILTRSIGTGIAFAALNQGRGRAHVIAPIIEEMRHSLRPMLEILQAHGATAATDVTGFGLAGHLVEMLQASRVSASLDLAAVPLYPGIAELAQTGIASTLLPENLAVVDRLRGPALDDPATLAILFDPQTAGGLLAGVPAGQADACLEALKLAGLRQAAMIGNVCAAEDSVRHLLKIV